MSFPATFASSYHATTFGRSMTKEDHWHLVQRIQYCHAEIERLKVENPNALQEMLDLGFQKQFAREACEAWSKQNAGEGGT